MQLNEEQKQLVEKIGDEYYTVKLIEKYYKEEPSNIDSKDWSFTVMNHKCVKAFMTAINGCLNIKLPLKNNVITAREAGRTSERTEGDGYISERGKFPRRALPKGKKREK